MCAVLSAFGGGESAGRGRWPTWIPVVGTLTTAAFLAFFRTICHIYTRYDVEKIILLFFCYSISLPIILFRCAAEKVRTFGPTKKFYTAKSPIVVPIL